MKKPVIILTTLCLALVSLAATPFVVSQWVNVTERNHAYERKLAAEAQEARKKREADDAANPAFAAFKEAVEEHWDNEADEFLADPRAYREKNPEMGWNDYQFIRDRAKKRYDARRPAFKGPYPAFEVKYPD